MKMTQMPAIIPPMMGPVYNIYNIYLINCVTTLHMNGNVKQNINESLII